MNEDRSQDLVSSSDDALLKRLAQVAAQLDRGVPLDVPWATECIYRGRNRLYRIEVPDRGSYVVKSFSSLSLPRRLYYSFVGQSKARRSHLYAERLARLGFAIGESLGYVEERNALGLLGSAYYVSASIPCDEPHLHPHARGWRASPELIRTLGGYIACLHERGVLHLDLSPGNILYHYDAMRGEYEYYLVDLNRMRFLDRPVSRKEAMANLSRLVSCPSVTRRLAEAYAEARGWDSSVTAQMLTEASDRFWGRRLFKLAKRWSGCSWLDFIRIWSWHRVLRALIACPLVPEGLRTRMQDEAEHTYIEYFSAEDLRHIMRHRYGYSYRLPHRYRSL